MTDLFDDFDSLSNIEDSFFQQGYKTGYEEGKKVGLIDGRELGRSSGFDTWEELDFYKGQVLVWKQILVLKQQSNQSESGADSTSSRHASKVDRILSNINQLIPLIEKFPKTNDSSVLRKELDLESMDQDTDLEALLNTIRSKYRVTCSSLGIRPRIQQVSESV